MAIQTKLAIISLIIPVLLSGCRASVDNARDTDDGVFPWPGDETQPGSQPSFDPGWYQTEWPDYIPDDIPEMEGNIRLVMDAPGSHVRIFYEDVTKNQLEQYLRLLEEEGFTLVYQVYVREGFPDNSEERLKKGDYDAVDITRGEYHMKISYGEDDITYDIYKSGFPAGLPASAGSEWPAELVNVVPKPERCALQSAASDSSGGFQITCRPEDDAVAGDYAQALQSAGYLPKSNSTMVGPGEIYGLDDLEISIMQPSTALVLISIWRVASPVTGWPSPLEGMVPSPDGCTIDNVTPLGGLNYSISCVIGNDRLVPDYIALLIADGFAETNRMETQSGQLISVDLEKNNIQVSILLSISGVLVINVSEKP